MRLHRFYIEETIGQNKEIIIQSAGLFNQLGRVFRLRRGDELVAFDGSGSDYKCVIADFRGKDTVVLDVREAMKSRYTPARKLYLYAAVVKKDNFEFVAEKATELGVTDIIPVIAERTEKKSLNEERLQKIVVEASEQSGRGNIPNIETITELSTAVKNLKMVNGDDLQAIAFHTDGKSFDPKDLTEHGPVAVFIGPEGGWSPDEIDLFHKNNIEVRCLGPQVLRSETAVIAALSQVVFRG